MPPFSWVLLSADRSGSPGRSTGRDSFTCVHIRSKCVQQCTFYLFTMYTTIYSVPVAFTDKQRIYTAMYRSTTHDIFVSTNIQSVYVQKQTFKLSKPQNSINNPPAQRCDTDRWALAGATGSPARTPPDQCTRRCAPASNNCKLLFSKYSTNPYNKTLIRSSH